MQLIHREPKKKKQVFQYMLFNYKLLIIKKKFNNLLKPIIVNCKHCNMCGISIVL